LDRILARALAARPQDRYPNSAEMAADLVTARDAFKQILIDGYLEYARTCIARTDLGTARDVLESLQEIDEQLPVVKELMDEVQRRQDPQWVVLTVANLRGQAERALAEKRLSEASRLVAQALQLEGTDAGLLHLRAEIQEADSRRQTVQQLLDDAESALQARKLEEARNAVDQALRLEPHDPRAAFVLATLVRQAGESVVQTEKTHPPEATPASAATAFPSIPGSLSIGILSSPRSASAPPASTASVAMGRSKSPLLEQIPRARLERALRNPRILVIAAAMILVLGFATAARVRSKHKPRPAVTSSQPGPAVNLPATISTGSPQNLTSNAPSATQGGTTGATPVAPPPAEEAIVGPGLTASTDFDCDWRIDGKPQERIKPGDTKQVPVSAGRHRVIATSLDGLDQWKTEVAVGKNEQKTVQIKLSAVVNKRMDALQAEQKRLADAEEEKKKQAEAEAERQRLAAAAEEAEKKRQAEAEALAEKNRQAEAEKKRAAEAEAAQTQAEAEQKRLALLQQNLWADPATGLWWARHDNGSDVNWRQAQSYCASLTLAGHSQWRLPTIEELQGILNPGGRGNNRVRGGLQTAAGYSYWSNTREGAAQAWTFNFVGSRYPNQLEYHTGARALCVRKGE
jgi:chemotaxis protein histidine kinase CheA